MNTRTTIAAGLALAALAAPAAAQAHVSLHPNSLPAGSFPTVAIRVPNESDKANTVKVDVKVPSGLTFLSTQPVPGWKAQLIKTKLAKPIQTDDGPVTEEVSEIVLTATRGGTPPGSFESFPIAFGAPDKNGATLTFKAVQTYSDGEVVRWIGAPDSEHPAPTVDIGPADGAAYDLSGDAGPPAGKVAPASTTKPAPAASDNDGASKGLAITALVIGILGLGAGVAALATRRRVPTA